MHTQPEVYKAQHSVCSLISLFSQQSARPLGETEVPGVGGDAGGAVVPAQDRPRPVWTGRDFPAERPSYFYPLLPPAVFVLLLGLYRGLGEQ